MPLHLVVVSTGAPRRSANLTNSADAPHQYTPSPAIRIGRFALAEHVERRLEIGAIRTGHDPIRHQRRLGGIVAGLARGFALRKFEMHRAGRRRGRGAHGAAHLLAHGLGVDGRAPLHDRLVHRKLVDALAQAGLIGGAGIGVGDRDQRRAVEKRVRHAVDHIGGAGAARRQANARGCR